MTVLAGKYLKTENRHAGAFLLVPLSFFLTEFFAFFILSQKGSGLWPLAFGLVWAVLLSCIVWLLPRRAARITYGIFYFGSLIYAGVQTGYYILFSEMAWLTDFLYAAEGADYADVVLSYPAFWWLGLAALVAWGVLVIWKFPKWKCSLGKGVALILLAATMAGTAYLLPERVFLRDKGVKFAGSDFGRVQSAEAAYENMFNAHRLYSVCGLYQTFLKDLSANVIYPMTPAYTKAQEQARKEIRETFARRPQKEENEMTGRLAGKNVILVLMESMDDWMITGDTPNLHRLMGEGINFTNFYTPVYGGIRTFNTEFCINTGSFLGSSGGYAFDYVTNDFRQSLPNLLRQAGYSAKMFHFNSPAFYSRGVFSEAMGYEDYVCYADYVPDGKEKKTLLYDDQLLFDNEALSKEFFREGQLNFNFVITRSAHLSYKYNEVLSHWGLKKYSEYRGLTGSEENDCALLKARLVDDFFGRMLLELEEKGQLENTVIIGVTDHYTYGYKNTEELLRLSGVEEKLLLEKTPCFIWSSDLEHQEVGKVLNTSDLLPTLLNLLGVDSPYDYIGSDAFDQRYEGFAPFSNGSWIAGDTAYDSATDSIISISGREQAVSGKVQEEMENRVRQFTRTNNLILETDYYQGS